jgi:hypothetical protein
MVRCSPFKLKSERAGLDRCWTALDGVLAALHFLGLVKTGGGLTLIALWRRGYELNRRLGIVNSVVPSNDKLSRCWGNSRVPTLQSNEDKPMMDTGLLLSLATLCDDSLPPPKLLLWDAVRQRSIIVGVGCWSRDRLSGYCSRCGQELSRWSKLRSSSCRELVALFRKREVRGLGIVSLTT